MKNFIAFMLACLFPCLAISQVTFQKSFGGALFEYGYTMQKTADGGFIVGGVTSSFGAPGPDFYVVRFDENGDALWNKIYENTGIGSEPVNDIFQTSDGGYIIGGYTQNADKPNVEAYFIKTDANGDTLWTKYWGGTGLTDCYLVTQTHDGNVLIGGYTTAYGAGEEDAFCIKLNVSTGDTIWTRVWGGTQNEWLYSMQETKDGGIILSGLTNSFGAGDNDILLIKTDGNGNLKWAKAYGDTSSQFGFGHCLQQTSDGGYIITGNGGFLLKTDSLGTVQWQKTYNGAFVFTGHAVQQTTDKGYIIGGFEGNATEEACLIKTDSLGNITWSMIYGGTMGDKFWAVKQANDGGYFVAGQTSSFGTGTDAYIVKTDSNGISGCNETPGNAVASTGNYSTANAPLILHHGPQTHNTQTTVISGYSETPLCFNFSTNVNEPEKINTETSLYPNPSNGNFVIETAGELKKQLIQVFDITGRIVFSETVYDSKANINASYLTQGIYNVRITSNVEVVNKKLVIVRE